MLHYPTADHLSARARSACARLFIILFLAVGAHAQTLTIWDNAAQNGFDTGYSYGAPSPVFNSTAQLHSAPYSIAFDGLNYNALGLGSAAAVSTATYPQLRFWVHGGAAGGQHLRIYAYSGLVSANASLDSYVSGGAVAAGLWREVTVDLTAPPFSLASVDTIYVQSDQAAAQPTVYLDDFVLTQPAPAVAAPMVIDHSVTVASMVSDRFTWSDSAGNPRVAVLAHNDTAAGPGGSRGGALREFRYKLANGTTRVASVTTYGNGGYAGFGYAVSHPSRSAGCVAGDSSQLGAFVSGTWERVFEGAHHAIFRFRQNYPRRCSTANVKLRAIPIVIDWVFSTGHDNPLWAVTWHVDQTTPDIAENVLFDDSRAPYGELNIDGEGFTNIDGVAWGDEYKFTSAGPTPVNLTRAWTWNVPNTVPYVKEWINGPLSGTNTKDATMGIVQTQTRAQQDAGGGRDPDIGSDITGLWGTTSALAGNGCNHTNPPWNPERIHSFPCADDWPYQANANTLDYIYGIAQVGDPNARMTWKTQYGFLGQTAYQLNDGTGATAPGWPKKSYSTYIVLGAQTAVPNPVDAQVTQVERMQTLVLNAGTGSVVLQGPAGIDRNDLVTYDPPGYNHVYGALAFDAAANQLDAYINVTGGPLVKPLIIVGNYTAGLPDTVRWNGVAMIADADYFASLRGPANELWITMNHDVQAGIQSRLEIVTSATVPDPPTMQDGVAGDGSASFAFTPPANDGGSPIINYTATCHPWGSPETVTGNAVASPIVVNGMTNDLYYVCTMVATNNIGSSAPSNVAYASPIPAFSEPRQFIAVAFTASQVYLSWNVVPAAETYHVYRAPNAVDFVDIGTTAGATNNYTDAGLAANTTYLYKVRAMRGVELSNPSAVQDATTAVFTDDPLTGGTTKIKAVHITQLRAGVNAVRAAAGLTPYPFTDGSLAGVTVKLVHLTQLRTALNQARAALGLAAAPFSAATTVAQAASFTEVREAIK